MLNTCPGNTFTRPLDHKVYELTDHLGNVRVVLTDKKNCVLVSNVPTQFTADVEGYSNYYAFGAEMPGRTYSSSTYRYGFNGKENDREVTATGQGTQDYGFRIYNPSLGKFLSVDPLTTSYPMLTPYQFASNRPVDGIDIDGLEYTSAIYWAASNLANKGFKWRDAEKDKSVYGGWMYIRSNWQELQKSYSGNTGTTKLFCTEANAVAYYQANPKVANYLLNKGMPSGWQSQFNFFKNSTDKDMYSLIDPSDYNKAAGGDLVFFETKADGGNPHGCILSTDITYYKGENGTEYMTMIVYTTNAVSGTDKETLAREGTQDSNFNTFGLASYTLAKTSDGWQLIKKTTTGAKNSDIAYERDYSDEKLFLKGLGRVEEDKIDPPKQVSIPSNFIGAD